MRNVTGDPWAGGDQGRAVRPDPVRRRVRALFRCATRRRKGNAAQGSRPRSTRARGARDLRNPRRRVRAKVRNIEGRGDGPRRRRLVGGGTSIMPRKAPVLYDFPRARQRRIPEEDRGGHADLRSPGVAAREPRPRTHQGCRRQVRDRRAAQAGEEELEGDWVAERDFSIEHRLFSDDEREGAPAPPPEPRSRTATCPSSSASAPPTCASRSRRAS